jgi:hypothetical protein
MIFDVGAKVMRAHSLVAACMLVACGTETASSDSGDGSQTSDGGSLTVGSATGADSSTGVTSATTASSVSQSGGDSSAGDTGHASGPLFDVGGLDTSGDGGTDTDQPMGPGSCRASEIYGAAGGYPDFDDPLYDDFDSTVLIMTSHDRLGPQDPQLRVIDISGDPPPPNMEYAAPMYIHPSWLAANFGGGIFGITLDSYGNIYVAASSMWSGNTTPGNIYMIDKNSAEISIFATLPNNGPAFGNLNYDCVSQTIYVSSHEDCRVYQVNMNGTIRSTYHHATQDVTVGDPADAGEPNGQFCPLGDRVWAVQSHYGRLYYSVWWEDAGRPNGAQSNEIWSVGYVDDTGVFDGTTRRLEATIPGLDGSSTSSPVSDISFAQSGWMLAAERTMFSDTSTSAHQSTTYELQQMMGTWQVIGETYVVGELPNSSAGGVDHDFSDNGYVWMTGDALDFYTPDVVYGVQGTPYGGGDITNSTLIDHDGDIVSQYKTDLGDCEIPIPGDATPPPPPPEG